MAKGRDIVVERHSDSARTWRESDEGTSLDEDAVCAGRCLEGMLDVYEEPAHCKNRFDAMWCATWSRICTFAVVVLRPVVERELRYKFLANIAPFVEQLIDVR